MLCAAISYNCRTNLELVKRNLTVQLYISDYFFQPHILNVIDRQKEIFQKDNAQPITARVTMDFLTQNNINVLLGHITTYGPT